MRIDFFDNIWEIQNSILNDKFEKFNKFYTEFKKNSFDFNIDFTPHELKTPSYASFCNVFNMKDLKNNKSNDKNAVFLHSVAHIEYSAIDIALDACYRFNKMPRDYYFDWLEVADDEIRHFKMVHEELEKLGYKYGDFDVHNGLFIALQKTSDKLIDRMAVLPRFMEANGLDANMFIMSKISHEAGKNQFRNILQIIHDEEINHVKKGDKWFKYCCLQDNLSVDCWIDIVLKHYPKAFKTNRKLDINARIASGFSKNEIEKILNLQEQYS